MRTLLSLCLALGRAVMMPRATLILENAALRQQLAVYQRTETRPRLRPGDRIFWVVLRRVWADWPRHLVLVKPATVIGWHRQGFTALWRRKPRPGRPRIPRTHRWGWRQEKPPDRNPRALADGFTVRRYRGLKEWATFARPMQLDLAHSKPSRTTPPPTGGQMDEFFVQVRTAGYWLSVALMSIALNLSAAYLKPPLDRLIARVFARVRERTNQRREARTRLVAQLRTDPTEYLMLAITRTHYLIRATLSLAFAGVFLFALFVNPGTGISTSILGVAATYSLILCGRQLTYSINVGELLADVRRSPQEPYATT